MKGIHGMILAVGLGIAGAVLNFTYLSRESANLVMDKFVGIAPGKTINRGERLTEDHIAPVSIPRGAKGNLDDFAYPYAARNTVIGVRVWRPMTGGSILLRQDTKPPSTQFTFGTDRKLEEGEEVRAIGVPIDSRKLISALVNPGDVVTFVVPGSDGPRTAPRRSVPVKPADAGEKPAPEADPPPVTLPPASDGLDLIGPFEVLTVGNRLGTPEVLQGAQMPQIQENVLTILVRVKNGKLEPEAGRLVRLLEVSNSRPLAYMLHPKKPRLE